jgi:hypothetical protein
MQKVTLKCVQWTIVAVGKQHLLTYLPGSPQWSFSFRFPHQNPVPVFPLPIRATCSAHLTFLDFITRTILGEEYRSLSSSLCSFLYSPVTSSLLGLYIHLSPLFSDSLGLHSSLNVSNQVSYPYKTTGKYSSVPLNLCILDSKLKDKGFYTIW